MKYSLTILSILILLTFGACSKKTKSSNERQLPPLEPVPTGCGENYLTISGNAVLGTNDFCVAKYEMSNKSGVPASAPLVSPWVNITRDAARAACASIGDRLISNAEWQTIAHAIEADSWNWGADISNTQYGISRGLTVNPNAEPPQPASDDDNVSCYLALQRGPNGPATPCDLSTFHVNRRIHRINGNDYIWDFSGNAAEWITDDITTNYSTASWVLNLADPSSVKSVFGPSGSYTPGPSSPPGPHNMYGLGYISMNGAPVDGVVARGGGRDYGRYAGIYTTYRMPSSGVSSAEFGFRCVSDP